MSNKWSILIFNLIYYFSWDIVCDRIVDQHFKKYFITKTRLLSSVKMN